MIVMKKMMVTCTLATSLLVATVTAKEYRSIKEVETVRVEVPAGNAPRLPYQLWVKYSDGKGEYRQVKWLNASEATEKAEANAEMNSAGSMYKVRGVIVGDNSTPNGYPVLAEVKVVDSIHNSLRAKRASSSEQTLLCCSISIVL